MSPARSVARIKATSYGLAYGLSSYGLAAQLGIPVPEAAALRERYFERFGKVRDYLEGLVAQARADGYTQTMFGRRRYLPDLTLRRTVSAEKWPSVPRSMPPFRAAPPTSSRSP